MRMIFTHGISDDTGALSVRLIRSVVQFYHGIENSSLYRLQAVSYIRKGAGCNYAHGVFDVGFLHFCLQVHFLNFVKYIIFHLVSP